MDIQRPHVASRRWMKKILITLFLAIVISGIIFGLNKLEPALPSIDSQSILTGTVTQDTFIRSIRGSGLLVPEEVTWISSSMEGQIRSLQLKPGMPVRSDTILVELSNSSLDLDILQARGALQAAKVDLLSRQTETDDKIRQLKSEIDELEDDCKVIQLQSNGDEEMSQKGFIPGIKMDLTKLKLASTRRKIMVRRETMERFEATREDRLAVVKNQIEQTQAMLDYKLNQMELLHVRAGVDGILMEYQESVGIGKRVTVGTVLAKVVDPSRLKAQLRIPEQQARDLAIGLPAMLDIMNKTVAGKVIRLNPGVVDGSVTVDIGLEQSPPQGSRPELSLTGTIELERVPDTLFVDRPVVAIENASGTLFKLIDDRTAVRVPVTYGRVSSTTVEIVKGLNRGDRVIISDMSRWDNVNKITIK